MIFDTITKNQNMTEKQSYVIRIEILMDIWIETVKVSFST